MTSIREFQNMMQRIYFCRDSARGIPETYERLREELDELGEAAQSHNKNALGNEFADVIAWLVSLANLLKMDLEKATLRKYNDRCPKCRSSPCKCAFKKRKG